jgi:bacteriorhodopsin
MEKFGILCICLFRIYYDHSAYFMAIWSILRPFGLFYDHLVYFVVIWYIYFHVWECSTPKNLATSFATTSVGILAVYITTTYKLSSRFRQNVVALKKRLCQFSLLKSPRGRTRHYHFDLPETARASEQKNSGISAELK